HLQDECERVRKDGSFLWLQATYNPVFDVEGKLVRILKIATDVTVKVNIRIEQESELKKKNSYLEHAARILRHDMHSGINTYIPRGISALRRRLPDQVVSDLKLEPPLKMLEGGLKHTQKVYKGVYEFTNLVKKDRQLTKELLNLTSILKEFLEGTAYKSDVFIGDLPSAYVSEQLFCTAIDNLIRNGLRYNDSPAKWVRVFMVDESHLGILDNGRGMTQEEFDFFSQNSMRRENQKESGSGLGLGICVAILNEHQFTITVEPAEPSGTLIKIKIF
ncbi:MAG: ATP-binding protein, partial [Bacteroidota bacterium]